MSWAGVVKALEGLKSDKSDKNNSCRMAESRMVKPFIRQSDISDQKSICEEKRKKNVRELKAEAEAAKMRCCYCKHWRSTDETGLNLIGICELTNEEWGALRLCSETPLPEDRVRW